MNIGIIGCGFVGLANATLLAFKNKVLLWEIDAERRKLITGTPFSNSLYTFHSTLSNIIPFKSFSCEVILYKKNLQTHLTILL